jgi:carbonic anhydrase
MQRYGGVMTSATQIRMSPDEALQALKEGNERFTAGQATHHDWVKLMLATADEQYPHSLVLSCLDSRVPVEAIFDQGIGDIFVGRVAGNIVNDDLLGSMEFGTKIAGSKLIVVLGHTSCGAVKAAIDKQVLGKLTATLGLIEPAISRVEPGERGRTSSDKTYVDRVVEANVRKSVSDVLERSEIIAGLVETGDLKVVGAVYDLESGRVSWLG